MGFNTTIPSFTTKTTNHANNFNDVHNKLLENDLDMNNRITVLSTLTEKVYTNPELLNGWTIVNGGTGCYLQKCGKEVKMMMMLTNISQPTQVHIAVIPDGFRPSKTVWLPCYNQITGGTIVGNAYVLNSGSLYFSGSIPTQYSSNLVLMATWYTS